MTVLSDRALGRAALERQLLLRRSAGTALDAVRHLVGLQAQAVDAPYLGLWSRLESFEIATLTGLLSNRRVVRAGSLRGTQHLTTAEDYRWLRPLVQPVALRARQGAFGRLTEGVGLDALAEVGRALLTGRVLTRPQLRDRLAERWPDADPMALAWSVQVLLYVVHPPPTGIWRTGGATRFALAEEWIGRPMIADPDPACLIRRYLAAYGPATVADVQIWSGLTRLSEVVDRMRLPAFRAEDGRELFDLPDAPRPDAETPAPVRFLPEFDDLIVAYADRRRLMTDEDRRRICVGGLVYPTFLVDGRVVGTWRIRREGDLATLVIRPHRRLSERTALEKEGEALLTFAAPDARRDIAWE